MKLHEAHFHGFRFKCGTVFKLNEEYYRVIGMNPDALHIELVIKNRPPLANLNVVDIDYAYENGYELEGMEKLLYAQVRQ